MKILVISHEFPPIGGGGANACYFLTREFSRRGHSVHVVTANFEDRSQQENLDGVLLHRLNSKRKNREHCSFSEMLSFLVKALPYAQKLHIENAFDICLVFFGIPSGPVGYILKKKYDLPYLIRFGGGDIPGFQQRFVFAYKILAPAIHRIWAGADALVANSSGLRDMALAFDDSKQFDVICNGVDSEYFTPNENKGSNSKQSDEKTLTILFVSRLIERKGLQYFIPTLSDLMNTTGRKLQLIVVGDGPYREVLEAMVDEYHLRDQILFVGQKNRDEILLYYQNADLFILPSKKEGMPNVVLEAMACGLPIVMTKCEGSSELIDGNGIVSSIENFSDNVKKLIGDDEKRKQMGKESRRRACELFSWNHTADDYLRLMDDIYSERR